MAKVPFNRNPYHLLIGEALILLAVFLLARQGTGLANPAQAQNPAQTTVIYPATDAIFANPERGFYHHAETHSNAYSPLALAELQNYRQNENISLILRIFYLDDFVATPISQSYLDAMTADFATLRQAGLKAVVRVAYTNRLTFAPSTDWPPIPPYGDAAKAQVLAHIGQLAPIFQANTDVISVIQTGLIGIWGEWYYTDHFVADPADPGTVSDAFHAQRGEVLAALLAAAPGRMVQLRTPLFKQKIYGTSSGAGGALPPANAFDGSDRARTGHHNDCFLASETDFGTYGNVSEDKAFLAAETKYLPMGGETCATNPPRSLCDTALAELAQFHWSYLNADYHPDVLAGWESGGCLAAVKKQLGYRLALVEGSYPDSVAVNGPLTIRIDLRNEGWAAPFNPRPVELVLREQGTGTLHRLPLTADPRLWLADDGGLHTISQTLALPAEVTPGSYDLLLSLPDADPALAARPEYAIRLANGDIWQAESGLNDLLHTVTVTAALNFRLFLPGLRR